MGYGENVPMQMPSLCARCGEKPPTESYGTRSKHKPFGSRITYTVDYSVPLCTECQAKIKNRERTGKIIMGIGGLILLIGLALLIPFFLGSRTAPTTNEEAIAFANNYQQYTPAAITAISGFLIALLGAWFGQRSFAKWNGKLFQFHNKSFHAAFASLNPSISRKV